MPVGGKLGEVPKLQSPVERLQECVDWILPTLIFVSTL